MRAGHDVVLDAQNGGAVVNAAGGAVHGDDGGVGAAAAYTVETVPSTLDPASDEELQGPSETHAFIGDSASAIGPLGTGGILGLVTAGHDVRLDAQSNQQFWTTSASGALVGWFARRPRRGFGAVSRLGLRLRVLG